MNLAKSLKSTNLYLSLGIALFLAIGFQTSLAQAAVTRLTDDTKISTSDSVGMNWAKQTSIAYLSNGNYVIAWNDFFDDGGDDVSDTYFQVFDQLGNEVGATVRTELASGYNDRPGVAEVEGGFVVSDQDNYRIFDTSGSSLTGVLSHPTSLDSPWFALKSGIDGGFVVSDTGEANFPYLESYDNLGVSTDSLQLADHEVGKVNFIKLNDDSGYLVIWNESNEIYGQLVSDSLELSGSAFRIDESSEPLLGRDGTYELAQNSNGDILVAWYDARVSQSNNRPDKVYGRMINSEGDFLGNEFVIASNLIEPSGNNLRLYAPLAIAGLGEKFVVAWNEKDGTEGSEEVHIKGRIVDGEGNLEGDVFKMETNESNANPTRRSLIPSLASNGSDHFAMTWFDGRNSYIANEGQEGENEYDPGTEIMANFWEYSVPPADSGDDDEEATKAHIDSWEAYKYTDQSSCDERLKLIIKGKHFDEDAVVKIGSKEASEVDQKSSKKLVATFCLTRLLEAKISSKRDIRVINPDADLAKAKEKIDLASITGKIDTNNFNPNTPEGVKNIQRALVNLGYLDSQYVTGVYGPITTEAVKKFQGDNGIPQTGNVGPLTSAKLIEKTK